MIYIHLDSLCAYACKSYSRTMKKGIGILGSLVKSCLSVVIYADFNTVFFEELSCLMNGSIQFHKSKPLNQN